MAENEIIKEVKEEIKEVGKNKSSLVKTLLTVTVPIIVAIVGVLGNSKYMAWRMDNVERQVGGVDKKVEDVAKETEKTRELLIQFLITRGYNAYQYQQQAQKIEKDKKKKEMIAENKSDQVDIFFGQEAQKLKEEQSKRMDAKAEAGKEAKQ